MVIVLRGCVIIDPRLARAELRGQSPTYPDREKEVGEFCISSLRSSGWIDKQRRGWQRWKGWRGGVDGGEARVFYLFLSLSLVSPRSFVFLLRYMTRHEHIHRLASSGSFFFLSLFPPFYFSDDTNNYASVGKMRVKRKHGWKPWTRIAVSMRRN